MPGNGSSVIARAGIASLAQLRLLEQRIELPADRLLDRAFEREQQERQLDVEAEVDLADSQSAREPRPLEGDVVTLPRVLEVEALVEIARDFFGRRLRTFLIEAVAAFYRYAGHR